MPKTNNIVHQYFKKQLEGFKLLVRLNPIHYKGTEITIYENGQVEMRDLNFDEHILDDLAADGFEACNPLEFNLYLSGLAK
jgi:hypothetical protein